MDAPNREFNFESFDRSTAAFMKSPLVTIQRGGTFSFNTSAYGAMGSPKLVELLYDRDQRVIGFKPSAEETLKTYPIREQGSGGKTYLVAGLAFLKFFEIPFGDPIRYQAELVNGVLIVDLKKPGALATSNRAKSRGKADTTQSFERDEEGQLRVVNDSG